MSKPSTSRDEYLESDEEIISKMSREEKEELWKYICSSDNSSEPLNYEYSDRESAMSHSDTRSPPSSVCSSGSSSRASSPTTQMIEKEGDTKKRESHKEIKTGSNKVYNMKRDNRKQWRGKAINKKVLTQWRIRSLDGIFMPDPPKINISDASECSSKGKHIVKPIKTESDDIPNLSVVINNDLCPPSAGRSEIPLFQPVAHFSGSTNSLTPAKSASASKELPVLPTGNIPKPIDFSCPSTSRQPTMQRPVQLMLQVSSIPAERSNANRVPQQVRMPPPLIRTSVIRTPVIRTPIIRTPIIRTPIIRTVSCCRPREVAKVVNAIPFQRRPPIPSPVVARPPPNCPVTNQATVFNNLTPQQQQELLIEQLRMLRAVIETMKRQLPMEMIPPKLFEMFCVHFLMVTDCSNVRCSLLHGIPLDFEIFLNNIDFELLMAIYAYVKSKPVFSVLFPYFSKAVSLRHRLKELLEMIDDVVPIDVTLVNTIVKSIFNLGLGFRGAIESIMNHGVSQTLNTHLLALLTTQNLDNWDLIVRLFNWRTGALPVKIAINIINLALRQNPINRQLCQWIHYELFGRHRISIQVIPQHLYHSFLQVLFRP